MYGAKFTFQNRLGYLVVGRKFTIFALFYFVFDGKFQVQAPPGAYIRRGDLTEGFWHYHFGGLIFGGAYFWNFTVFIYGLFTMDLSLRSIKTNNWSADDLKKRRHLNELYT